MERARANNRQGFPVGGAYLRYANEKMQQELLPGGREALHRRRTERLARGLRGRDARTRGPRSALGVVALAALAWAQRRNYLRTNRVFNHGLVAATAAAAVVLLWLVAGHTVARAELNDSYDHGVRSLARAHDARIASLKARGNENLTLVARGAETTKVRRRDGTTPTTTTSSTRHGRPRQGPGPRPSGLADDDSGRGAGRRGRRGNMTEWKERHAAAREQDENGDYQQALDRVIGAEGQRRASASTRSTTSLATALAHEQARVQAGGRRRPRTR